MNEERVAKLMACLKEGVRKALVESESKLSDGYAYYTPGGHVGVPARLDDVASLALNLAAERVDNLLHSDRFVVGDGEDPIDRVLDTVKDAVENRTRFQQRVASFMKAGHKERIARQMAADLENNRS